MTRGMLNQNSRQGRKQGSALLVTLLMVSLLLVVVMAFVVTVRLEMRSLAEYQTLFLARANARLGANLALAELQRTLGPDTRVSTRAELLSANTPDATGPAHESTRFWTGVWDSGQDVWDSGGNRWVSPGDPAGAGSEIFRPYTDNRNGRFLSWLISLPPAAANEIGSPVTPVPPASVRLAELHAEPLGGGAPQPIEVRAPLVPSAANQAYAWWVSDEGVKANVRLSDPFRGQAQPGGEDIPRLLFPHRENFSATRWFEDVDFDDPDLMELLDRTGAGTHSPWLALRNADLSPEAELVLGGTPSGASLLSDYTIHSMGVLSNNKKGGLRKDLSLAFWRDPRELGVPASSPAYTRNAGFARDFSDRITLHGRIFNQEDYPDRTVRSTLARSFFGPQWDVLRDFHNSFQKLQNPNAANPTAFFELVRTSDDANRVSRGMFGGSNEQDSLHRVGLHVVPGQVLRPIGRTGNLSTARVDGFVNSSLHPVIVSTEFFFNFDVFPEGNSGTGGGLYGPRLNLFVVVNLWNPHNVALSTQTLSGGTADPFELRPYFGQISFNIENTTTGESRQVFLAEFLEQRQFTNIEQSQGTLDFVIPMHPSGVNFLPGEIRQFRLASGNQLAPAFSETPLTYRLNTIATRAMDFEEGHGMRIRMNVDEILESNIGSNFRMDFSGVQFFRFGGILRDDLSFYEDFGTVGPGGLIGDPLAVGTVEHVLKAASELDFGVPNLLSGFTPRAVYPGGALTTGYTSNQPPNYFTRVSRASHNDVPAIRDGALVRGFWGDSRRVGNSFVRLFDVPRRPPESLGQYQHAALAIFGSQPAYAFGNSLAHPHVSRLWAHDLSGTNNASQIDLSWFLNDAIWDDFFLSTIDPDDAANPSLPQRDRFVVREETRDFSPTRADDYLNVASNLMLNGAFNINSTSVEAWTAFLSSLGGPSDAGNLEVPFHRFSKPEGTPNTAWTGAPRDLSVAQIRRLAEEMVAQVRARGPFLSLSDFVNRRLVNDDRGAMGAVQAAILAANLNNVVPNSSASSLGAPVAANVFPNAALLATGDVSQADVLTTIGPKMSARSDTFVIRSYGQVRESGGSRVQGEAWMEMLVQRIPEEHPASFLGRRFQILNVRYFNADEI